MNWRVLLIISGALLTLQTLFSLVSIAMMFMTNPSIFSALPPTTYLMWVVPTIINIFVIVSCFGAAGKLARQDEDDEF